jgi:hypothetical protein
MQSSFVTDTMHLQSGLMCVGGGGAAQSQCTLLALRHHISREILVQYYSSKDDFEVVSSTSIQAYIKAADIVAD